MISQWTWLPFFTFMCLRIDDDSWPPKTPIISNQTSFFFYPTNVNWQLDQTKKTQRSPAGDRTRVFRLPVGRSNHWATKPRQELRANFCLSPNCQFFFTTRWPECLSLQTRRDQRNSLDLNISNRSNRKFVPVGTIPSNQTSFFFYPTNVNWQLDQMKKTQRSPAGDRTRVFRLPVGRSNHWATKPRQELRANFFFFFFFCLSPNCQFFFTTRWPECLSLQTRRDQRNSLDLNISNRSNRKFVPVGTIPSNQTSFFFYPTNVTNNLLNYSVFVHLQAVCFSKKRMLNLTWSDFDSEMKTATHSVLQNYGISDELSSLMS